MGQNKHSHPGVRHTPPARLSCDTIFLGVPARAINLIVSLTQPSHGGRGGGLPIVGFLNCGPTCKANSNALSIYGCTLLPNTKTCIHSTPSVAQYMPSICQNIYVSRHVLVYRYIHFWTNGSQVFWNGGSTQ